MKLAPFILLSCGITLFPLRSFCDIVKTENGNFLTGKIIQQSNDEVIFADSDSVEVVPKSKIIEIYKTGSPDEDLLLMKQMGFDLSADSIINNYRRGQERLDSFILTGDPGFSRKKDERKKPIAVLAYSCYGKNYGKLSAVLPRSFSAGMRVQHQFLRNAPVFVPSRFCADLSYYRAAHSGKSISGECALAGFLWRFGERAAPFFRLMAGGCYYRVDNRGDAGKSLCFSYAADAGVIFSGEKFCGEIFIRSFNSHDSRVPLYSVMIGAAAGLAF